MEFYNAVGADLKFFRQMKLKKLKNLRNFGEPLCVDVLAEFLAEPGRDCRFRPIKVVVWIRMPDSNKMNAFSFGLKWQFWRKFRFLAYFCIFSRYVLELMSYTFDTRIPFSLFRSWRTSETLV